MCTCEHCLGESINLSNMEFINCALEAKLCSRTAVSLGMYKKKQDHIQWKSWPLLSLKSMKIPNEIMPQWKSWLSLNWAGLSYVEASVQSVICPRQSRVQDNSCMFFKSYLNHAGLKIAFLLGLGMVSPSQIKWVWFASNGWLTKSQHLFLFSQFAIGQRRKKNAV